MLCTCVWGEAAERGYFLLVKFYGRVTWQNASDYKFFCSLSVRGWNCYSVLLQCCQVKV